MSNSKITKSESIFSQDRSDFARLGERAVGIIDSYLNALPGRIVDPVVPETQRTFLSNLEMPEQGMSAEEIMAFLEEHILPWPQPIGHQRSFAWVNSPPMPVSLLADSIARSMNCSLDGYDYSGIFLMVSIGRWLMQLTGYPDSDESMALLFSGGTAANLNALTTARYSAAKADGWNIREEGLQSNRPIMIAYASDQVHSSVQRCIEQLGIGSKNLRNVPVNNDFQIDVNELEKMISEDSKAGRRPFAVIASAGTTNVGAIDPFHAVADICEKDRLWFHVDGAYGGLGGLDPEYADKYAGLERADTLTIDPHKWLHVPVDCGALLTRHKSLHRETYTLIPDYLKESDSHSAPWPYEYILQLTYADRGLKTWAAIARMGVNGIRDLIIRCNRLAAKLDQMIEVSDDFELLAPTSLSIVNFRFTPKNENIGAFDLDHLNQHISDAISVSGEAHLPTTKVDGRISLRACILHYDNNEDDLRHLLKLIRRLGRELVGY